MSFEEIAPHVHHCPRAPEPGALTSLWKQLRTDVLVVHAHRNHAGRIGDLIRRSLAEVEKHFSGRQVCLLVTDSDEDLLEAALDGAVEVMEELDDEARACVHVVAVPYPGWNGHQVVGKGAALEMVLGEMRGSDAALLLLLDGDLTNELAPWQAAFARSEAEHRLNFEGRPLLFTARFARHFLEDRLGRFLVGPLSTLTGRHLSSALSGELVLSRDTVERLGEISWDDARRQSGSTLGIVLECLADPGTVLYEHFLGVRHAPEARFSSGLEDPARVREVLDWLRALEADGGAVTAGLEEHERGLDPIEGRDSDRTGVVEGNPGGLPGFDVDRELRSLVEDFPGVREDLVGFLPEAELALLEVELGALRELVEAGEGELRFLGIDSLSWREHLYLGVACCLSGADLDSLSRALAYLCRAAHLEFVRGCLADLGYTDLRRVRRFQETMRVEPDQAGAFYQLRVDAPVQDLAIDFFDGRLRIAQHLEALREVPDA